MKTAIYARKSTKKLGQKETIENQIKICKRYAQDNGLEIVDIKTDQGTATDDLHRPEVKELITDAVNGKYECVIMKGISRLYRDTEKGLRIN
jgi:site-specific DNA recombinase